MPELNIESAEYETLKNLTEAMGPIGQGIDIIELIYEVRQDQPDRTSHQPPAGYVISIHLSGPPTRPVACLHAGHLATAMGETAEIARVQLHLNRERIGISNHAFHYRRLYRQREKRSIERCLLEISPLAWILPPTSTGG